jgi:hypothetical protein
MKRTTCIRRCGHRRNQPHAWCAELFHFAYGMAFYGGGAAAALEEEDEEAGCLMR